MKGIVFKEKNKFKVDLDLYFEFTDESREEFIEFQKVSKSSAYRSVIKLDSCRHAQEILDIHSDYIEHLEKSNGEENYNGYVFLLDVDGKLQETIDVNNFLKKIKNNTCN